MSIPLLNEKLFTFLISIKAHDKVKDFYKAMGNEGLLVSDILLLSTYTLPCHACLAMIFNTVFIRFVQEEKTSWSWSWYFNTRWSIFLIIRINENIFFYFIALIDYCHHCFYSISSFSLFSQFKHLIWLLNSIIFSFFCHQFFLQYLISLHLSRYIPFHFIHIISFQFISFHFCSFLLISFYLITF